MYIFEYNSTKSMTNKSKHGIDFEEAKAIWKDINLIEIKAKSDTENRYALIGKIKQKIWIAFVTYRSQKIRIISVRRARMKEVNIYES